MSAKALARAGASRASAPAGAGARLGAQDGLVHLEEHRVAQLLQRAGAGIGAAFQQDPQAGDGRIRGGQGGDAGGGVGDQHRLRQGRGSNLGRQANEVAAGFQLQLRERIILAHVLAHKRRRDRLEDVPRVSGRVARRAVGGQ
jgi:hypothetical protein